MKKLIPIYFSILILCFSCKNSEVKDHTQGKWIISYLIDTALQEDDLTDYHIKKMSIIYEKDTLLIKDTFEGFSSLLLDSFVIDDNFIYGTVQSSFVKIQKSPLSLVKSKKINLLRLTSGQKFNKFQITQKKNYFIVSRGIDLFIIPSSVDTIYDLNTLFDTIKDKNRMYPSIGTYDYKISNDTLVIKTGYFWGHSTNELNYFTNKLLLNDKLDFSSISFPISEPGIDFSKTR